MDELHPRDARADHHQTTRPVRGRIRITGGEHSFSVQLRPRWYTGPTARSQENCIGLDLELALRTVGDDPVGTGQPAVALDDGDTLTDQKISNPSFDPT